MGCLTAAQILAADDIKKAPVDVPEWGGTIYVKTVSGTERDRFEESLNKNREGFRVKFVVAAACDENGKPLFTAEQAAALAGKSGAVIGRVFDAAWDINGFSQERVEELGKDSPSAPSEDSTSA